MADIMVLKTQQWLNLTYGLDPRFHAVAEDGKTGWPTIYALTRALQIELGIEQTADSFGPTSRRLYAENPLRRNDGVLDRKYAILQGALWCKGYDPGHYASENPNGLIGAEFDEKVERAVLELKRDAGIQNPDGVVTTNFMAALLSMDAFKLLSSYGGKQAVRAFQQEMNRKYESYIGIMPCDGVYGRNTNKAVLYALQAEEGLPVGVANGNFGPTTKQCCPTIPYGGMQKNYYGQVYTAVQISQFTRLLKFGLYVNGFGDGDFSGEISSSVVKQFQKHHAISVTGEADLRTWLSIMISCGDTSRPAVAADCATILDEYKARTLATSGYQIVGRYLTGTIGQGISKALTKEEIKIIFDFGLRFFPIYQTSARSESYFTPQQGAEDAIAARTAAEGFGIPSQTIIYFAVDFDAMDYQVTNSIIPYFRAVNQAMGSKYKIGIYGARNICSRVANAGYSVSSFVGDMSTGFSGNLGFKIPDDWAFDQFATVTEGIGSGIGEIEIDKNGYSGRDVGVSSVNVTPEGEHDDGLHNSKLQPDVLLNRSGTAIPVYARKVPGGSGLYSYSCTGDLLGYIEPGEFYTRYHTGYISDGSETEKDQWITNGDAVHRICFRDRNGSIAIGYIQEQLSAENYNKKESSLPNQEPFHYYNYNEVEDDLVKQADHELPDVPFTFDVKKTLPFYTKEGRYLGTLQPGEKILLNKNEQGFASSQGGLEGPWLMWFDERLDKGGPTWSPLNQQDNTGAFVSLGYEYGALGAQRAIW